MSYGDQLEWERERKRHKQDLEDAEYEREKAEREVKQIRETALRHNRELMAERDDYADEAAQHARLLSQAKRFIAVCGLTEKFEEWKREQLKRIEDDE